MTGIPFIGLSYLITFAMLWQQAYVLMERHHQTQIKNLVSLMENDTETYGNK